MKSVTEKIEESLIENQRFIEAMESHADSKNGNLFDLPPFSMEIENGLVRPCEPVTIHLRATAAEIPQGSLTVEADYLGPNPGRPEVLNIAWHPDGPGKWRAEYVLTPSRPGNWRVKWEQPQFWLTRIFGVVADNELVVTLWVGSNKPRIDTEIHAHSLPGDTWVPELFNITRDPEKFIGKLSAQAHDAWRYGDRLVPFCNSNQLLPRLADWNLFKLPAESQRQAFGQVQELWLAMGLKPLEIIGSYTPGHATPGILQGLGIKALNSLCIWQDFEDGDSWQINHISPPISPYFHNPEDFRKVSAGKGLVLSSMGNSDSTRVYDSLCFSGVPSNSLGTLRYTKYPGTGANVQRFYAVFDGWLGDRKNNKNPLFVTIGLENFCQNPEWEFANKAGVEYSVRRAREGGVVFASAADVADYFHRHFEKQPEQVSYQKDVWAGMRGANKPARLADRIEVSNDHFHCVHFEGETLPRFFWDYRAVWDAPEWDYKRRITSPSGLPFTTTDGPLDCSPPMVDLRGFEATHEIIPSDTDERLIVTVRATRAVSCLPIALWNLTWPEVELETGPGRSRLIPVTDELTGSSHLLLVLYDLEPGVVRVTFRLRGLPCCQTPKEFNLGDEVTGYVMHLREGARTYLWSTRQNCRARVRITGAPPSARVMYLDGSTIGPDDNGTLEILIDEKWQREAPSVVHAVPVQCGGQCEFSVVDSHPIQLYPFVRHYLVSAAIPNMSAMADVGYPDDTIRRKMISRHFHHDFADIKGDLFKGIADHSIVYFEARFRCDRDCLLTALMGYDGPFKAWVDGEHFFSDLNGTNPGFLKAQADFKATAGEHSVMFALSANGGKAWGMMMRLLWVGESSSGSQPPKIEMVTPQR